MRSTATARRCAAGWRPASCLTCWRSRPPSRCHRQRHVDRRRRRRGWLSRSPPGAGCASAPAMVPRAAAGMRGPTCWGRWLLVRRNPRTGELAYYLCAGPAGRPLVALVRVAGARWRVEEAFQAGKGLCGLDQHQVRRWRSWYRWVTLAMLAYAFLVVAAVT